MTFNQGVAGSNPACLMKGTIVRNAGYFFLQRIGIFCVNTDRKEQITTIFHEEENKI